MTTTFRSNIRSNPCAIVITTQCSLSLQVPKHDLILCCPGFNGGVSLFMGHPVVWWSISLRAPLVAVPRTAPYSSRQRCRDSAIINYCCRPTSAAFLFLHGPLKSLKLSHYTIRIYDRVDRVNIRLFGVSEHRTADQSAASDLNRIDMLNSGCSQGPSIKYLILDDGGSTKCENNGNIHCKT